MASFGMPQFRKITDTGNEIREHCGQIEEAFLDYEAAADLPADERTEVREQARDEARAAIDDLLTEAEKLRALLALIAP